MAIERLNRIESTSELGSSSESEHSYASSSSSPLLSRSSSANSVASDDEENSHPITSEPKSAIKLVALLQDKGLLDQTINQFHMSGIGDGGPDYRVTREDANHFIDELGTNPEALTEYHPTAGEISSEELTSMGINLLQFLSTVRYQGHLENLVEQVQIGDFGYDLDDDDVDRLLENLGMDLDKYVDLRTNGL